MNHHEQDVTLKNKELDAVTGAFGYTGKYITSRLLSMGKRVLTLTGHPNRPNPFGNRVSIAPFNFKNKSDLIESLRGATTLYNTYWVRFCHGEVTFDRAVENTRILVQAAEEAGVRRIVHISITNASEDSSLPYFRGKGLIERIITDSRLSYAIIRPTVIFGIEDILINNIAWLLRQYPVFFVPGSGDYRLQPIFVEDMAEIAVNNGQLDGNIIIDAVGPEIYRFDELVQLIADRIHKKARIVHIAPKVALFFSRMIGFLVKDVVLTQDELDGLMSNLLVSERHPTGQTKFSDWLSQNADGLGTGYTSELARHY